MTEAYAIYQLANDPATYGPDAGKFIVTSADREQEFSGPMSEKDAKTMAGLLLALTALREDFRMLRDGEWVPDRDSCEASLGVADAAIAAATGKKAA